jgi:hypothetical protein
MPCPDYTIYADADISSEGVLNFEIPSVKISGIITFNDQQFFSSGDAMNGIVYIKNASTDYKAVFLTEKDFAANGGVFERKVIPGKYRFLYRTNICSKTTPCYEQMIIDQIEIKGNGSVNLDVPFVNASVKVTADSSEINKEDANNSENVWIEHEFLGDGAVLLNFKTAGSGPADRKIIPANYLIDYRVNHCNETMPCPISILAGCE